MQPYTETLFITSSTRVKAVDFHPDQKLIFATLHTGELQVWNYESQKLVKEVKICDEPTRAVKFIARMNWIVTGSDDTKIRVYDATTFDLVYEFEAHSDYIRSLVVHPTLPYVISTSDDMFMHVWDWENEWRIEQTFFGHQHYVMNVAINPKDPDMFATASLDQTVKLWRIGEQDSFATLEGHTVGVNCVKFYGDEFLISGSDDKAVKIWNWKTGIEDTTAFEHKNNITAVNVTSSHFITASEDSTALVWTVEPPSFNPFSRWQSPIGDIKVVKMLNYEMGRVWCIEVKKETDGSETVVLGTDNGAVVLKIES